MDQLNIDNISKLERYLDGKHLKYDIRSYEHLIEYVIEKDDKHEFFIRYNTKRGNMIGIIWLPMSRQETKEHWWQLCAIVNSINQKSFLRSVAFNDGVVIHGTILEQPRKSNPKYELEANLDVYLSEVEKEKADNGLVMKIMNNCCQESSRMRKSEV